jgi:hypothetical protein
VEGEKSNNKKRKKNVRRPTDADALGARAEAFEVLGVVALELVIEDRVVVVAVEFVVRIVVVARHDHGILPRHTIPT